jgi:ATP-dependent DNA helicase PIF1
VNESVRFAACSHSLFLQVPFDSKLNSISYLPIKLAWAITIHSAQGMTIDALEVDLGTDIFAFGQAYTGLSRATSLSSVRIVNVLQSSFVTSPKVIDFFTFSKDASSL